jgi:NAD(P)-dependent dehydrogenase (short-subunit alcohol dehydrogenase family)
MSDSQKFPRVAVITGASSGIGAATARALHADGYHVALLARRLDRIEALAAELGDGAMAITADVTDRDALVGAAHRVKNEFGVANVLVNNAGIMLLGPFSSEQRDDYRSMVKSTSVPSPRPRFSSTSSRKAAEIWSTSLRLLGAPPEPPMGSTPPRSGASMVGPNLSDRNCFPTSASR